VQEWTRAYMRMWGPPIAGVLLLAAGCSRSDQGAVRTADRLRTIAAVYLDYAAARGAGPANERELRTHMSHSLAGRLSAQAGSIEAAKLFVSARDGEPFVLNYGQPICQSPGPATPPIAYERSGRDGTRFVAFANGLVKCVDESSMQPLLGAM
jgi:hypothetical protein